MPTKATVPRRRPSQERAKATRDHILATAARLFGQRGIAGTSTNRIAAESGVSIGTVYRYFSDRAVMVDELLVRLLEDIEKQFVQRLVERVDEPFDEMIGGVLEVVTDYLVERAGLVRALVAGLQYYSSGLPEFEPRMRSQIKDLLIRKLGPGDDHVYDVMSLVVLNTCFAAVVRIAITESDPRQRKEAIAFTARTITALLDSEANAA
ncbi:TetR/AcrR family transcriptional regulator [Nocardia blacklockiae]|uniref:TetR/AcrR family transcriptional regulator n=1 Tax=Nocardia blacklockiae TaxID=480036 RepID=UPI001895DABF|nr:TetR/AcrR family transcriptional regulator [Nocardia blacklockiae]MBF6171544.1 TetR/AcrR family transcriptional regulator [Nocardia blacklockiae]